jgi:hypothetical protein
MRRVLLTLAVGLTAAVPAHAHEDAVEGFEFGRLSAPFLLPEPEPAPGGPAVNGRFGEPFEEPTVEGRTKPAGATMTVLADGRVLYWNALEGIERDDTTVVTEYGYRALNDQTRVLSLDGPSWARPTPEDAGLHEEPTPVIPVYTQGDPSGDGALFRSDQLLLWDGRVLAAGGTNYYLEPGVDGVPAGVSELEGLRGTRIFDPADNSWTLSGEMHRGRWYPTLVELPDTSVFVASGVRKLVKPVYTDHPEESGTNVAQTETWDPDTGEWTDNGAGAKRSLPLYPRLHLLPNGKIFYAAAGQAFNPFGQAYDELGWNNWAIYDPKARSWADKGVAGLNTMAPGFRGSTFSLMLPLRPGKGGGYTKARFLAAGGVLLPTPGSYFPVRTSVITKVDTAAGDAITTRQVGDLSRPRWYSTGVLLPTGEVIAFSGADRDAVATPGFELPIQQAELFDPKTKTWRPIASGNRPRTYHNAAALLPDGRVLVGGHAPISTLYGPTVDVPGFAPNHRDPSFELFEPPYLFRGERPEILGAADTVRPGQTLEIAVDRDAKEIRRVVLMRHTSITHLRDANQRSVILKVTKREGRTLTVQLPAEAAVLPPGPYSLFVNRRAEKGLVPSEGEPVLVKPA